VAQNESLSLAGPAGRLEALLMYPEGEPVAAAVVCHADPRQGGMMHFRVVFRAAKALQEKGLAVLRFNFRGVGLSEGVHDHGRGEQADAQAALDETARRFPREPLLLGGFSFGSVVAARVAACDARVRGLFLLGFPVARFDDLGFLGAIRVPRLFVQGDRDAFGTGEALRVVVEPLPEPRVLIVVPEADHFFGGKLDVLHEAITTWAASRPWQAT
jgi:alpha/beta superfamily hydrolase